MTARERQRRRRPRSKDPARYVLIVGGAVFGAVAILIVGAGFAYVASIANKVPPLSQLKVTTYGIASTVYAADGKELGLIKSTILRQPITDAADAELPARRDGRDRGPRLLPARRDRLPRR